MRLTMGFAGNIANTTHLHIYELLIFIIEIYIG